TASYSYDVLGRLATETRTLPGDSSHPTVSKTISYDYNLDGSLSKLHYPSGAVVTYAPWSNGSVAVSGPGSALDTANNINYVPPRSGPGSQASYGPDGALTSFLNGKSAGFAGISNTFSYNKRLQPCRMTASTAGLPANCADSILADQGNVFDISYDFH